MTHKNQKKSLRKPPVIGEKLLRIMLTGTAEEDLCGDFEEIYNDFLFEKGRIRARIWYLLQVFAYFPGWFLFSINGSFSMFANYLKITFRNIVRNKGYSFINISGLAVGMACCILIMLWVFDELNINRFHKNINNIYWVATYISHGDEKSLLYGTPPAVGTALSEEYPEIQNAVRIENGGKPVMIKCENKKHSDKIQFADLSLFRVFSFPVINGKIDYDEKDPYVILLNESTAEKYFGSEDPVGKILNIDNRYDVKVTGVFKDIPGNSTIRFKIVMPLNFLDIYIEPGFTQSWENYPFQTYLQLREGTDAEEFNEKIQNRIRKALPESRNEPFCFPFKDLYLKIRGRDYGVNVFSIIAFIILIIACINFTNLATARSASRAREVGLRKVVGAQRRQLINQFIGESMILAVIALFISIILALTLLPAFESITGKTITAHSLLNPEIAVWLLFVTVFTGILSGSYPAVFLSSFKPVKILQGSLNSGAKKPLFRKVLVVSQFTLAIVLFLLTAVIYKQSEFMQNKQTGLNRENVLYFQLKGEMKNRCETFKSLLLTHPDIKGVTMTVGKPTNLSTLWSGWTWKNKSADNDKSIPFLRMSEGFENVFGLELTHGRYFQKGEQGGVTDIIINESLAAEMEMKDPVGEIIQNDEDLFKGMFRIIGVVKNFHFRPVYRKIDPLIIFSRHDKMDFQYLYLKAGDNKIPEVIKHLKKTWNTIDGNFPFEYHFLDEDYENMYLYIKWVDKIIGSFAVTAIFISCLGLFGLASFLTEQRTKEIGIRKVLGASVSGVIMLLSKEYVKCIAAANLIAWPAAYYLMIRWLEDYAYKTDISIWMFMIPGLGTFVIVLLTAGYQSVKAARANPAVSLKYE